MFRAFRVFRVGGRLSGKGNARSFFFSTPLGDGTAEQVERRAWMETQDDAQERSWTVQPAESDKCPGQHQEDGPDQPPLRGAFGTHPCSQAYYDYCGTSMAKISRITNKGSQVIAV